MSTFRLTQPLPRSTLLLEASAGTGKTFTIAALAVRYLVEDKLDIDNLLLITFSTNAAAELSTRVFDALQHTATVLADFATGKPIPEHEVLAQHLADCGDVEGAIATMHRALDQFDQAMICTTHAFCQMALRRLGVLGDADDAEQLSGARELIDECAADVYLRQFADKEAPALPIRRAMSLAHDVCSSTLPLEPANSPEAVFGREVREEFRSRKRSVGILTFDDLVLRLRNVLDDQIAGPAARQVLQRSHAVVLVDEFQDTDPVQWKVIERAFVAPDRPTILIGDPKQSIYGFRNADLMSYLDARRIATVQTLDVNHRSDAGVVRGIVALLEGLHLGADAVQVHPVKAKYGSRIELPVSQRVWIRQAPKPHTSQDLLDDLAKQVRLVLDLSIDGRPASPADLAILVRTSAQASKITAWLNGLGCPAVQFGGNSVWQQPAAADWHRFLHALEPDNDSAIRISALTDLVGASIADLRNPERASWLWSLLRTARHALIEAGPSAALDVVREGTGLEARLLPTPDGARYVTDLLHIAELLDASGTRDPRHLRTVIGQRANHENDADVRITTDAPAVRVMTLHAAKGLEFPIVMLPDLSPLLLYLSRPFNLVDDDGRRVLWVRAEQPNTPVGRRAAAQAREEELRLLYVGLTRGKHLSIAWHAEVLGADQGPLSAALLHGDEPRLAERYRFGEPRTIDEVLIEPLMPLTQLPSFPAPTPPAIMLARSTRIIDQDWRRTSYSGLTQGLHDAPSGADELEAHVSPDELLAQPAPMGTLPAGTAFGTLVHEILEHLDWAPKSLGQRIRALVDDRALIWDSDQRAMLAAGLEAVVATPLYPLAEVCLSDVPVTNRLAELDFDLPLQTAPGVTVGDLAMLIGAHLPNDDPLAPYPGLLSSSTAAPQLLTGMLTGSIDVVLRTPDERFHIIDYKTNRLAARPDEPLILGHYTYRAMREAMMRAHYPLQAILYSAALHRYLSLRLCGYDPDRHLGGIGYLFVRGMAGKATPLVDGHVCGVFDWHPSPSLIIAVSDLLGGGHA